jgi:phenylacetate-CoA ligase
VQFRRIEGFLGRSDNMVKVKGINIFPQAIGPILEEHGAFAGEFICKARRDAAGREEFIVVAEARERSPSVAAALQDLLKRRLGIAPTVELVEIGSLAPLTQTETRQKPIRLIDERYK